MTRSNLILLALVVGIAALPMVGGSYALRLGTIACMYGILALSWNIVGGFTGYPSFATGAFFGLRRLCRRHDAGEGDGLASGPHWRRDRRRSARGTIRLRRSQAAGPLLRGREPHARAILKELTTGWSDLTGGGMGLTIAGAGGDPERLAAFSLRISLALAVLTVLLGAAIKWSRLGFGLDCIRMNETAAAGIGIDAQKLKTYAFTLSSVTSAIAGGVYAGWIGYIDPTDVYDVMWSVKPIVAVLLGGVGTILGPIVGAAIFVALEEIVWRNVLSFSAGGLGVLIVLLLLLPAGVLPSLVSRKSRP